MCGAVFGAEHFVEIVSSFWQSLMMHDTVRSSRAPLNYDFYNIFTHTRRGTRQHSTRKRNIIVINCCVLCSWWWWCIYHYRVYATPPAYRNQPIFGVCVCAVRCCPALIGILLNEKEVFIQKSINFVILLISMFCFQTTTRLKREEQLIKIIIIAGEERDAREEYD